MSDLDRPFLAALAAATTDGEALTAIAERIKPGSTAPTPADLAEWWADSPAEALAAATDVLREMAAPVIEAATEAGAMIFPPYDPHLPDPYWWRANTDKGAFYALLPYPGEAFARASFERDGAPGVQDSAPSPAVIWHLIGPLALSRQWQKARRTGYNGRHPLGPIVRAWIERPPTVRAVVRADPILPSVQAVRESPERAAGRLAFGGIVDSGRNLPAQLPLLPAPEGPRVPLLELANIRGGPVMTHGRGAPLDLRLFIGACLVTPHHARAQRTRLAVSVRELRDWLWPNGWHRGRHWPKLREALWRARDYTIPDGRGLWLPVALRRDPGADAKLDDLVVLDVELPGAGDGPVIDRRELALLGVQAAPRFNAYIAAHSVAWLPGRTRIPHPKNRAVTLWTGDADRYPILTADDRRRLAFSPDDRSHRTRAEQEAPWKDLPGVEIIGRMVDLPDGGRGWRIVPTEAAEAIRKRRDG